MLDPKVRVARKIESEGGTRYEFAIEADPAVSISDSDRQGAVDAPWERFEVGVDNVWIERIGDDTVIIEVPNSADPVDVAGQTRAGFLEFRMAHPDHQSHVGTDPPIVPGADFLLYAGDLSTKHNIQSGTELPFAIILDGEILSTPVFNEAIAGGSAVISGDFTEIEAKSLAVMMQSPIPFSLKLLSEETLAATR